MSAAETCPANAGELESEGEWMRVDPDVQHQWTGSKPNYGNYQGNIYCIIHSSYHDQLYLQYVFIYCMCIGC